jgi:hypothetical protein
MHPCSYAEVSPKTMQKSNNAAMQHAAMQKYISEIMQISSHAAMQPCSYAESL